MYVKSEYLRYLIYNNLSKHILKSNNLALGEWG